MESFLPWVGPLALAAAGWAFRKINALEVQVARLEASSGELNKRLDRIEEKLDRLLEGK